MEANVRSWRISDRGRAPSGAKGSLYRWRRLTISAAAAAWADRRRSRGVPAFIGNFRELLGADHRTVLCLRPPKFHRTWAFAGAQERQVLGDGGAHPKPCLPRQRRELILVGL